MSSHRKPRLSAVRKRARAVTLCAATISAAALPSIAQAATGGSTAAKAAAPTKPHVVTAVASRAKAPVKSVSAASASATTKSTSRAVAKGADYTVVSGDTLSGIAERSLGNGNDYHELYRLNKNRSEPGGRSFKNPDLILVGWKIELPSGAKSAVVTATAPASSTRSASDDDATSSSSSSSSTSSGSASSSSSNSYQSGNSDAGGSSASSSTVYYGDNLDGWINEAIAIMNQHGISAPSYNAIYQTAMNESAGQAGAVNGWDANASNGTPSIGVMQMIQPTFNAYALSGYGDIYSPVDNIIAASLYAQAVYGSLDNVVAARCGGSCWYGY